MATMIFLSNDAAEISGYKKAYIGFRSPNAASTFTTSVTDTTGSGDNIVATDEAGGTELGWITAPLASAVAITALPVLVNVWAKESNAAANAATGVSLHEYTTSEQAAFLDHNHSTELTTTIARIPYLTANPTATTIDAGNRLVIKLEVVAVGTMGASQTVTIDYNGATAGSDGDTFILLNETLTAGESQYAGGAVSAIPGGPRVGHYDDLVKNLNALVAAELFTNDAPLRDVITEMEYQRDLQPA